jgi:hypothetical protein
MKLPALVAALALFHLAAPAAALDLCYSESTTGRQYAFRKVKLPKQPEEAAPFNGVRDGVLGMFGTLYRMAGGDLALSAVSDSCFVSGSVSAATLDVNVTINCNHLGGGIAAYTWTRVACD